MKKYTLLIILLINFSYVSIQAQDTKTHLSINELKDDTDYLKELFENTHPDPYTSFGGRVMYNKFFEDLIYQLPMDGCSTFDYYRLLRPFFAKLGDSHSSIMSTGNSTEHVKRGYPIVKFDNIYCDLVVTSVRPEFAELLGAKVLAIEDIDTEQWLKKAKVFYPVENEAGAFRTLRRLFTSNRYFYDLFGEVKNEITFNFQLGDGEVTTITIPYQESAEQRRNGSWLRGPALIYLPTERVPFFSAWLNSGEIAYIRIETFNGREGFEFLRSWKRNDLKDHLSQFYDNYMNVPMPENLNEAINNTPSLTETFHQVLSEMKAKGCHQLIIDIRDNGGGWSAMGEIIYYMLYGDQYLEWESPVSYATLISQKHLDLQDLTIDEYNQKNNTQLELGEFRFLNDASKKPLNEKREEFLSSYNNDSYSFFSYIDSVQEFASLDPSICVVVNGGTLSAAYHFMYYLWKMGATIVGSPPAQAGNAFVDNCTWKLPNSGLTGSISRTAQIFFPDNSQRGILFEPDVRYTWENFRSRSFSMDGVIVGAIHWMRHND